MRVSTALTGSSPSALSVGLREQEDPVKKLLDFQTVLSQASSALKLPRAIPPSSYEAINKLVYY